MEGGGGHAVEVADGEQAAVDAVGDELGDAADAGGDGGDAGGHGFEGGEAEGLHLGGHEHEIGEREELEDVVLLAEEVDAVLDVVLACEVLGEGAVGAVADEHEAGGELAGDAGEDFDHVADALDGAEVGEMDEEAFGGGGELRAHGGVLGGVAEVDVAVDEVADDLDGVGGGEGLEGAVAEVGGDGGDAVGLLDAEAGDGEIGGIEADEGDVGAVEGGDDGEIAGGEAGGRVLQHLAGEDGGDGVGDGVVDVEEIEGVEVGDLGHAGGEGEVVGRVLEERVVGGGDLVEVDAGFAAGEAEGLGVGDEVDVVAAGGELDAELGGDDAGAAVGGIAGDADLHGRPLGRCAVRVSGIGREGGEGDEVEALIVYEGGRDEGEKGGPLGFSFGAEPGGDLVEVVVVIAGVADELPCAGGEGGDDGREGLLVEGAGSGDADGAVGGVDVATMFLEHGLKGCAEAGEGADLQAPEEGAGAEAEGPIGLKGVTNGGDAETFGHTQEGAEDDGEEVGVFVSVEVGGAEASVEQAGDLGFGFALDVALMKLPGEGGAGEGGEGGAETAGVTRIDEGRDGGGRRRGQAVGENDVAADAEEGTGAHGANCVFEGGAVAHQGCRGECAGVVELHDGAVDARREAEVIGVNDELDRHGRSHFSETGCGPSGRYRGRRAMCECG